MVAVHTFEVYPTVEELNEAVGRAFLDRLNTLIDEAGADSRINLAISGGAITTTLLPSLLPSPASSSSVCRPRMRPLLARVPLTWRPRRSLTRGVS